MGIGLKIPAFERAKAVHALDSAVTVVGIYLLLSILTFCLAFCFVYKNFIMCSVKLFSATTKGFHVQIKGDALL
jgi:hypothetical protein